MTSPEITLTHLDEPLFDGAGATKRDLVDYLEAVGDRILSVLSGRPLSVIRGRAGQGAVRILGGQADADLVRQSARGGVPRHARHRRAPGSALLPGARHRPAGCGRVRAGGGSGPAGPGSEEHTSE